MAQGSTDTKGTFSKNWTFPLQIPHLVESSKSENQTKKSCRKQRISTERLIWFTRILVHLSSSKQIQIDTSHRTADRAAVPILKMCFHSVSLVLLPESKLSPSTQWLHREAEFVSMSEKPILCLRTIQLTCAPNTFTSFSMGAASERTDVTSRSMWCAQKSQLPQWHYILLRGEFVPFICQQLQSCVDQQVCWYWSMEALGNFRHLADLDVESYHLVDHIKWSIQRWEIKTTITTNNNITVKVVTTIAPSATCKRYAGQRNITSLIVSSSDSCLPRTVTTVFNSLNWSVRKIYAVAHTKPVCRALNPDA